MKVLLILGPENEKRISMTKYSEICLKIYEAKGYEVKVFRLNILNSKNKVLRFFTRYFLVPFQLLGKNADLYHVIDHSYGHSILFLNKKCFITIHDLIPLELDLKKNKLEEAISKFLFKLIILIGIKKSSKILVVSNTTGKLLGNFFNLNKKILLSYNPPINRELPYLASYSKDIDIILFGSSTYKNNIYAVNVCLEIKKKLRIFWINPDYSLLKILKVKHEIETRENLNDIEIFRIYSRSKLILNLSLSEGFGWIPFEASQYECCAVMSNINIFRELHPSSINNLQPLKNVHYVSKYIENLLLEDSYRKDTLRKIVNDFEKIKFTKYSINNALGDI